VSRRVSLADADRAASPRGTVSRVALVDVVVVSYNSAGTLRGCVEPLSDEEELNVIVVDNASTDESVEAVSDLAVGVIALDRNLGFARGCNRGWASGSAPYALFLNPDARIDKTAVRLLATVLEAHPSLGLVAPQLVDGEGSLEFSQRRFPRLRSTYAQALFLHRIFTHAQWADEVVRDPQAYERPGSVEWLSGACVLLRRSALERVGGWDEGYFHYGEDIDLCRRLWSSGFELRYEPTVCAVHLGGASAPRAQLLPRLAASRIRYAQLHRTPTAALLERIGIALGALTHAAFSSKGRAVRAGHLRAFRLACSSSRSASTEPAPTTVEGRLGGN
jgi:N-acetylglucosaminyl-diphospho-decaprenol L-rhamnosyltransferase